MIRRVRRLLADDDGQATVETAFALSTLIAVLMVALGAIAVLVLQRTLVRPIRVLTMTELP